MRHYGGRPLLVVSLVSFLIGVLQRIEITIRQRLCEALHAAGLTVDAGESLLKLVKTIDAEVYMGEPITGWVLRLVSTFAYSGSREMLKTSKGVALTRSSAIVYARAPPSFQARYFSFRPPPITSPSPSPSPAPAQSSVSLSLTLDYAHNSRFPSPFRSSSPSQGSILRLPQQISPTLFSNELEYLYTAKGLGEAFEVLFDTSASSDLADPDENRVDKSAKTSFTCGALVSTHTFASPSPARFPHQIQSTSPQSSPLTASSSSLASPTFAPSSSPGVPKHPLQLHHPHRASPSRSHFPLHRSPPHPSISPLVTSTRAPSLSHRTCDLGTAFAILNYLSLAHLYSETQARIVYEMFHGLYHAFLEFDEYVRITNAEWGIGGCRCRQCARRVPCILEFTISDESANYLERGARRTLVGLFGEGWSNSEFAGLPQKIRDSVVKGVGKCMTPTNVFPLLFAAQHAMKKMGAAIDSWADVTREMVSTAQKTTTIVLSRKVLRRQNGPRCWTAMAAALKMERGWAGSWRRSSSGEE